MIELSVWSVLSMGVGLFSAGIYLGLWCTHRSGWVALCMDIVSGLMQMGGVIIAVAALSYWGIALGLF